MIQKRTASALVPLVAVAFVLTLSACSGGGGGGEPGVLLSIVADGASETLWENVGGVPTMPSVCPFGVFLNGNVTFMFNGAVDPSSVPPFGFALGSINIISAGTGLAAQGTFAVEDDPALPAGNHRRVVFRPVLPGSASTRCSLGLEQGQIYQVTIPVGDGWPSVLVVGGARTQLPASTCFSTCGCPDPGTCVSTF